MKKPVFVRPLKMDMNDHYSTAELYSVFQEQVFIYETLAGKHFTYSRCNNLGRGIYSAERRYGLPRPLHL